jgi:amino acid permease
VVALVSIAYLVVLVVYHYSTGDTIPARGEIHLIKWQGAIATLSSFPVIVFAYTCHQNVSRAVYEQRVAYTDMVSDVLNLERNAQAFSDSHSHSGGRFDWHGCIDIFTGCDHWTPVIRH